MSIEASHPIATLGTSSQDLTEMVQCAYMKILPDSPKHRMDTVLPDY